STSGTVNDVWKEHAPVEAGPSIFARVSTGPEAAGADGRAGPVAGQGGGETSPSSAPAFHSSCIHNSEFQNLPETSIEDPAAPEVEERTTGGGLSPKGRGHATGLEDVAGLGVDIDDAGH